MAASKRPGLHLNSGVKGNSIGRYALSLDQGLLSFIPTFEMKIAEMANFPYFFNIVRCNLASGYIHYVVSKN